MLSQEENQGNLEIWQHNMPENNRIEYKRELTGGLEKEIVAFLNYHDGGIIYIGLDKFGQTYGSSIKLLPVSVSAEACGTRLRCVKRL
jgi:hypothetical protein